MRLLFLGNNFQLKDQNVHSPFHLSNTAPITWHFIPLDFLASQLECFLPENDYSVLQFWTQNTQDTGKLFL